MSDGGSQQPDADKGSTGEGKTDGGQAEHVSNRMDAGEPDGQSQSVQGQDRSDGDRNRATEDADKTNGGQAEHVSNRMDAGEPDGQSQSVQGQDPHEDGHNFTPDTADMTDSQGHSVDEPTDGGQDVVSRNGEPRDREAESAQPHHQQSQSEQSQSEQPHHQQREPNPADRENRTNVQAFESGMRQLESEARQAGDTFSQTVQRGIDKIGTSEAITGAGEIIAGAGQVVTDTAQAVGNFENLGELLEGTLGEYGEVAEAAGAIAGENLEAIAETSLATGEAAGEIAGHMIERVGEMTQDVGGVVSNVAHGNAGEGIGEAIEDINDLGGIAEGEGLEGVVEVGRELVEGAAAVGREVLEAPSDIGESLGQRLGTQ